MVQSARVVLVDFDGPVARLFPGDRWLEVSAQVRRVAAKRGGHRVAEALGDEPDHVQCLRIVGQHAPELLDELGALVRDLEVQAAQEAQPHPDAVEFLQANLDRGATVAIVTNNDPAVVPLVLGSGSLARRLSVYGRSGARVDDLKPAPDLILRALADAQAGHDDAVFLGDSVTDVQAGQAAGVRVVGVAEDADRREALLAAGADSAVPHLGHPLPGWAGGRGWATAYAPHAQPARNLMTQVSRLADTSLPSRHGTFRMTAYRDDAGQEHVVLSVGISDDDPPGAPPPLVRMHSECLTGDALGSRRCDCGEQLQHALALIARQDRGALVYIRGHEGRGIGLVEKLRTYELQDSGLDTVDANLTLGHPADARTYGQAAGILRDLGVESLVLLSSNPAKEEALLDLGLQVHRRIPLIVPARPENVRYLDAKRERMRHDIPDQDEWSALLAGQLPLAGPLADRYASLLPLSAPRVVAQLGQSMDGFIASRTGDAIFVTGPEDREHLHRLRALVDAVVVGASTVAADDSRLTVRAVPGPHPVRIVLDPRGILPPISHVLTDGVAPTVWVVGPEASVGRTSAHVDVVRWPDVGPMDPHDVLALLGSRSLTRVLVEGGGRLVSAWVAAGAVDRLFLTTAPVLIGEGIPGLRLPGQDKMSDALRPPARRWMLGSDLVTEFDLRPAATQDQEPAYDTRWQSPGAPATSRSISHGSSSNGVGPARSASRDASSAARSARPIRPV